LDSDTRSIGRILAKVSLSLLLGGIAYLAWMATFIFVSKKNIPIVETPLWLLAPVVTAIGFTLGIMIIERPINPSVRGFLHIYWWPLIGCALGALAVYWYGPMLIVFSMLLTGELSIIVREVLK
jgi:hypothetical protein